MRSSSCTLILALTVMGIGCGGETPPPQPPPQPTAEATPPPAPPPTMTAAPTPPPKPTTAEASKQVVPAIADALSSHDAKKLASFYAEDAVISQAGMEPAKGRDAIAANAQKFFDAFSNVKVGFSRVFVKGDTVISEWTMTGTHAGEFHGVKASEKPIGVQGVTISFVDPSAGLIKEEHRYVDGATIMSQIGASKQKARPMATLPSSIEWHISKGTPDEDKNLEIAKSMSAAINGKKEADFLALHSDDAVFDDMTQPTQMKGKDEAKKWFKMFLTAFPDANFANSNQWAVDDFVINESTMTGTQKGPLPGIPATKKTVTIHGVDIGQLKDGKFVHGWFYGDGMEMAMQLGLVKAPKAPAAGGAAAPTTPKETPKKDATPAAPKKDGTTPAAPKK
jgi:steroid delta-isomerase-like uncharacterized protein